MLILAFISYACMVLAILVDHTVLTVRQRHAVRTPAGHP
jgi:hypothetical protein